MYINLLIALNSLGGGMEVVQWIVATSSINTNLILIVELEHI